jgi:hypothetical protein
VHINHTPAIAARLIVTFTLFFVSVCGLALASSHTAEVASLAKRSKGRTSSSSGGNAGSGRSAPGRAKCSDRTHDKRAVEHKRAAGSGRCATKRATRRVTHDGGASSAGTPARRGTAKRHASYGATIVTKAVPTSPVSASNPTISEESVLNPEPSGSSTGGPEGGSEPAAPSEPATPAEVHGGSGSSGGSPDEPVEPTPSIESGTPFRFFSSSSFWNVPVAEGAVLDPGSGEVMGVFDRLVAGELRAGSGPWVSTTNYSVPIYTVGAGQAMVAVRLEHAPDAALSAAWSAVPLPANAEPAPGTDGDLVVWQPSTDRLWEFWRAVHGPDGWSASWGGAMQDVSSNIGVYGSGAWPGAEPWWGVSASSLSLAGGLITFEDLEHGRIEHALAMAVPGVRGGVYASPAQRSDGRSSDPLALPEGAHLRLNPKLDLASLHLPRFTLMVAEAAQRYGIFVRDGSSNVQLYAQDPKSLASNPYTGPDGYFEGQYPVQLMASFPWDELQLLKMELHTAKS